MRLSPETFPVSIDVVGLYPNIPHEEGLKSLEEALERRDDGTIPTKLMVDLMREVLENNIFGGSISIITISIHNLMISSFVNVKS